jgi:hypothetical protein
MLAVQSVGILFQFYLCCQVSLPACQYGAKSCGVADVMVLFNE